MSFDAGERWFEMTDGGSRGTWHAISYRVRRLRDRLFEPRNLSLIGDVSPQLPDDYHDAPAAVRRGMMFSAMLDAIAVPIRPDELIVGDAPYLEFTLNSELFPSHLLSGERESLIDEAVDELRRTCGPDADLELGRYPSVFGMGRCLGHIIADYELPLRIGFGGLADRIRSRLAGGAGEQAEFLSSALLCVEAGRRYIGRYAEEARRLAGECPEPVRREELAEIADVCERLRTEPPRGFREALQLVWFTQLLLEIESGISAFSFGRADQYLYPFLARDLESGALSRAAAQELLDCFWVRANEQNECGDAGRALTIGGVGVGGEDLVNDLTYMMLESAGALALLQPKLNARVHSGSPSAYLRECCRVLSRNIGPLLHNDDEIIPALRSFGLSAEDAAQYGIIGCYETGVPGKERPWPMSGCLNVGKCLELALNDGVCRLSGRRLGLNTGRLTDFTSYADVERAYDEQVAFFLDRMVVQNVMDEAVEARLYPHPFLSTLVDGCIESGRDIASGGAALSAVGVRLAGLSAVADSLAAVKTMVFDRGLITLDELDRAIESDFHGDRSLGSALLNRAPKFGNDDDRADAIARRVGESFCREALSRRSPLGGRFKPGLFSFYNFKSSGEECAAMPCGREAGRPFTNGVGPMRGCDRLGPSAVLNSVAKLNYLLSPNGSTLDLIFQAFGADDAEWAERLRGLVRAYFDMGGAQLQVSRLSVEAMRDAQVHPESHTDLIVRVTGFSEYFGNLAPDAQDEIITRSMHALP